MRYGKWYFFHIIILTAVIGFLGSGCKKSDGINNNNVIRTPYSLYFADRQGALYNTNDGSNYKLVFMTDNFPTRAVATSGLNIIMVKKNLHLSADNGLNFNPRNFNIPTLVGGQSMMLDAPDHKRIYLISNIGNGIEVSTNNGVLWQPDFWDAGVTAKVTSLTRIKDGKMYAIDNSGPRIFERLDSSDTWSEVTVTTPLPSGPTYILSHFNNAVVAGDISGAGGVYISNNNGKDWVSLPGTPTNQELYSIGAPHEQVLLAGTDSAGIYRLVGNTFMPSNNGLQPFTKVYSIVGKQDIYKNEIIKQYVYIATNNGLFRSEDLGQNWTLMRPGDIRALD